MEYVVLWASHPSWMTLQFPRNVAELLGYRPEEDGPARDASRSISFLARGPGVARVVATHPAREAIAVETVRSRFLATVRPGERHVFSLPNALVAHLGLRVTQRGPRAGRGSDDGIVWIVPAPDYYEYRSVMDRDRPWTAPSSGPFARVYVTRSLYPFPESVERLDAVETAIEAEWRPAIRLLQKVARPRRQLP
jgi:hypothetical protein